MPLDPPVATEFLPEIYSILAEVYWILRILNRLKPTADINSPYVGHDILYGKETEGMRENSKRGFCKNTTKVSAICVDQM